MIWKLQDTDGTKRTVLLSACFTDEYISTTAWSCQHSAILLQSGNETTDTPLFYLGLYRYTHTSCLQAFDCWLYPVWGDFFSSCLKLSHDWNSSNDSLVSRLRNLFISSSYFHSARFLFVLRCSLYSPLDGKVTDIVSHIHCFQTELKHRKQQTLAESYNFAEENPGNPRSGDNVPYDQ